MYEAQGFNIEDNKFLSFTFNMLEDHPYKQDLRFLHAAVLVRGGSILSKGFNKPKRNMLVDKYKHHKGCNIHAEVSAILNVRKKINLLGSKIYVARKKKLDGLSGNSRPCISCQAILKRYGIKKVYYTLEDGFYETMKVY